MPHSSGQSFAKLLAICLNFSSPTSGWQQTLEPTTQQLNVDFEVDDFGSLLSSLLQQLAIYSPATENGQIFPSSQYRGSDLQQICPRHAVAGHNLPAVGVVLVKLYVLDCVAPDAQLWTSAFWNHIWSFQHPVHLHTAHVEQLDAAEYRDSTPSVNATLDFGHFDRSWRFLSWMFHYVHHQKHNIKYKDEIWTATLSE